jgi:hypothetical protein
MGARKMIEINDKDKLIRIFKTISWLDSKRWGEETNYNFINFAYNDLTNSEKKIVVLHQRLQKGILPYSIYLCDKRYRK